MQNDPTPYAMNALFATIIFLSAVYLIAMPIVMWLSPRSADRFLLSFANTSRAHYVEMLLRLAVGFSLIGLAPQMYAPIAFSIFGWIVVLTTVVLLIIPWRKHRDFAEVVTPMIVDYKPAYGAGSLLLGLMVMYGLAGVLTN